MAVRKIIEIDKEKCTGCGQCVIGCAEGALAIVDGKATLISDIYCDGLGACIGECPEDALNVIEREAPEFDEEAVEKMMAEKKAAPKAEKAPETLACGCAGSMVRELKPLPAAQNAAASDSATPSALRNWPIQLHLVPPSAPFLENSKLLIAADCAGFSVTDFHKSFLPDHALIIACPKLDETGPYEEKLTQIFRSRNIREITALYMTVPCCFGLVHLVRQALAASGKKIPLRLVKVDPSGEIVEETCVQAA